MIYLVGKGKYGDLVGVVTFRPDWDSGVGYLGLLVKCDGEYLMNFDIVVVVVGGVAEQ